MAVELLKLSFQILMFFRILWLTSCTTDCFCYTFNTRDLGWRKGRGECRKDGGDLVTMETEKKWKFINSKIQGIHIYPNEWYIGLKKEGGEWKWVNDQILSINKWQRYVHEPNGDGECVAMAKNYPAGTQGLFKDLPCSQSLMYVCEYRKGNPSCKDGYYPPRCNETNIGPTPAKPTQSAASTTQPTQFGATATYKTQTASAISTPNDKRNFSGSTTPAYKYTTHNDKNKLKPFPITLVVVLVGILLTSFICLLLVICVWKRKTGTSERDEVSQRQPSEMATIRCININEGSSSMPEQITETDAVIYADIKDDHARFENPETTTYAEIHDYMSPCSLPVPAYPGPYEATEKYEGPVCQSVDNKDTGEDDVDDTQYENAPNSATQQPGEKILDPKIDPDEQLTVTNAIYATVDKSKKKKSASKQVEFDPVYAQVDKSAKTKINFST